MRQSRQLTIEILRFIPENDTQPHWEKFSLTAVPEDSLLHVLHKIKDEMDSSLSYRWSCQMAVCGSCGAMINGQPKLLCSTFVKDFPSDHLRIEALAHFPVIRDLIIEMDHFIDKLESVKPYVLPAGAQTLPTGEYQQTPAALAKFKSFSQCINCLLCYSACPQYGRDDHFIGPAALALAQRYNLDSRDGGADERRDVCASDHGTWECTFAGMCSDVCPKHVDPGAAIQQMKVANTLDYFKQWFTKGKEAK